MKKIKKLSAAFFAVSLTAFTSCVIGLGNSVDLQAPVVEITSPDYMANVSASFTAYGSAKDNTEVTKLLITFAGSTWTYQNGAWSDGTPEGATFEKADDGSIKWSMPLTLPEDVKDDQYTIMVSAYDKRNNTSNTSVQTRTVIYDTTAPLVTITSPVIKYKSSSEIKSAYSSDDYRDFSLITNYLNGNIEISGYQDEDYSLKELHIWLCGNSESEIYWDSGSITENLRNWSVTAKESDIKKDGKEITEKTFMQIITESIDAANNTSQKKSLGWICYWPESKSPWITCDSISSSQDLANQIYPSTNLQGNVYDDEGIKNISLQIYSGASYDSMLSNKTVDLDNDTDLSNFYLWGITVPQNAGTYKIKINAEDVDGNLADTIEGFFKILDISTPAISLSSPDQNETLFGDKDGNVNFKITASDDSAVKNIKMLYLKDTSLLLNFLDGEYEGWENVSSSQTSYTDTANGNIIYYIDAGEGKKEGTRTLYYPEKTINLFDDLNIGLEQGKTSLTSQTFIFRVEDSSGKTSTLQYSCSGDTQKPQIEFDKFIVTKADGYVYEYSISELIQGKKLGNLENTDSFVVTGKWSDNSSDIWGKNKISDISLEWGKTQIPVTKNADGTWTTSSFTIQTSSSISLKAYLTDYAQNTGSVSAAFTAEAEKPELLSISSTASDGTYTKGQTISLKMKFNKAVEFTGSPTLTLNNNKILSLTKNENDTTYYFDYTIGQDDDVDELDVKAVGGYTACRDSSNTSCEINIDTLNAGGTNLAGNKNIAILTKDIALNSCSLSDDGTLLTLKFNHAINKNTGSITISQNNLDRVPALLTAKEYSDLIALNSSFADYYTKGTNGYSAKGVADLSAKYILNYDTDASDSTLVEMYEKAKKHIVTIAISSSAVKVSDATMTIDLSSSYALPVKGATYTLTLPDFLLTDIVNADFAKTEKTFSLSGVEEPVIRIKKSKANFDTESLTASQPMTSQFKIDCQTPGASLTYSVNSLISKASDNVLDLGTSKNTNYPVEKNPLSASSFTKADTEYSGAITLGNESVDSLENWQWGAKYAIHAEATKGSASKSTYNLATKSLFLFKDDLKKITKKKVAVCLRGGDSQEGTNLTPGFPLSWDANDTDGIAILTNITSGGTSYWYYTSWNLPTKAYLTTLAGKVNKDSARKGPYKWYWSSNAWTPFRDFYPLYPGESRTVETGAYETVWGQTRGNFSFDGYSESSSSNPTHTPSKEAATYDSSVSGTQVIDTVFDMSSNNNQTTINISQKVTLKEGDKIAFIWVPTFDDEVDMWMTLKDGWWQSTLNNSTAITGGCISSSDNSKIVPSSDEGGIIYYTLSATEVSNVTNTSSLIIQGYGMKITSIQVVSGS